MKPKATHTEFRKGQRVHVIMRDGSHFDDRYKEKKSGVVVMECAGRVRLSDVRSISIQQAGDA